jgi:hypothetical protein
MCVRAGCTQRGQLYSLAECSSIGYSSASCGLAGCCLASSRSSSIQKKKKKTCVHARVLGRLQLSGRLQHARAWPVAVYPFRPKNMCVRPLTATCLAG